jgi:sodium/bile acid cotransporter 7
MAQKGLFGAAAGELISGASAGHSCAADALGALLFPVEVPIIRTALPNAGNPALLRLGGAYLGPVVHWLKREWFIAALVAVVAMASIAPCSGSSSQIFGWLATGAISTLFFLQGARLSREAVIAGVTHWRLHLAITVTTFMVFPLLGMGLIGMVHAPLPRMLQIGLLFLCVLPSTVQSSIALTSIARGNVAGAVCAASGSNLIGMVMTPLLLGAMLHTHGGGIDLSGAWKIVLELFVPFIVGHLLRPWVGDWTDRNRAVLAVTDRGSILLVVYTAFSAAVVHGIWHQLPLPALLAIVLADAILLAAALTITMSISRLSGASRADEIAIVFCGSQKSLVAGVPMANVLFSASTVGAILLPIMIYHQLQLFVGAWLARRYAAAAASATARIPERDWRTRMLWCLPMPQAALARVQPQRILRRRAD